MGVPGVVIAEDATGSESMTGAKLVCLVEIEAKYERAARYPWLPVAPDPPEP